MIDTQAIRTRILHLALQGKLVPQSSSDDSAIDLVSALCKKIKGQSFQNNISQQEIPYDIPNSWIWCRLSDIGTTNIGLTYHPEDVSANGTIVARSSNIVNNRMDYTDLVKVTCPIRDNQFLNTNDILICARNGSKALVGKCAVFEGAPKTVAFGAFMAVFRTPLYHFVYYYFNSQVFKRNFFNDESKQINQVTQSILKQSLIPVPPMQEQERIVEKIEQSFSILDTIDELQAKYTDNLTALKSKLIDAAIQGKLTKQLPEDGTAEELYQQIQEEKQRLIKEGKIKKQKPLPEITDEEIPFDIPANWKWVRINGVGITTTGGTPSKAHPEYYGGYYPFFKPSDLDAGDHITTASEYLSEAGKMVARQLSKGTILVCCIGSIGKCSIIDLDGTANQQINALTPVLCDSNYILYAIKNWSFANQLTQGSRATTVSIIKKSRFDNCILPLPPLAEQKRIVQKLEEILPLCEKQRNR